MTNNTPAIAYDPVCGTRVQPNEFRLNVDICGHKIYFCAETCREKFLADPHKFLKPKGWWRRCLDSLTLSKAKQFGSQGSKCCGVGTVIFFNIGSLLQDKII